MLFIKKVFMSSQLVVLLLANSMQAFSWKQLIPYAYFDRQNTTHFGDQPVSAWYQEKTREFLRMFGVAKADQVPVRQIKLSPAMMHLSAQTFYDRIPGLNLSTGIWLNEVILNQMNENSRLWYVAHEAAHYHLSHWGHTVMVQQILRFFPIAVVTGCVGVSFCGFNWLADHCGHIKRNYNLYQKLFIVLVGLEFGTDLIDSAQVLTLVSYEHQKILEKMADLAAAQMLCDGYVQVVEDHVKGLKEAVDRGLILLNGVNHPSFQVQLAYMQEFWNGYLAQHPEYGAQTVVEAVQTSVVEQTQPA